MEVDWEAFNKRQKLIDAKLEKSEEYLTIKKRLQEMIDQAVDEVEKEGFNKLIFKQ